MSMEKPQHPEKAPMTNRENVVGQKFEKMLADTRTFVQYASPTLSDEERTEMLAVVNGLSLERDMDQVALARTVPNMTDETKDELETQLIKSAVRRDLQTRLPHHTPALADAKEKIILLHTDTHSTRPEYDE